MILQPQNLASRRLPVRVPSRSALRREGRVLRLAEPAVRPQVRSADLVPTVASLQSRALQPELRGDCNTQACAGLLASPLRQPPPRWFRTVRIPRHPEVAA